MGMSFIQAFIASAVNGMWQAPAATPHHGPTNRSQYRHQSPRSRTPGPRQPSGSKLVRLAEQGRCGLRHGKSFASR